MTALYFVAFSMITVPAYVAMFHPSEEDEELDDAEAENRPYAVPSVTTEDWDASPIHRSTPISGIFQRTRLKRLI